MNVELWTKNV